MTTKPEFAEPTMTDATMPPLDHPEPHTMKWSALELSAIHEYARAYAAQCLAAVAEDAARYRWLCENGDRNGGLFIGMGDVGTWGECGHSEFHYKEHADAAIDNARGKKQ